MANHSYFPEEIDASTCDVVVKASTSCNDLPAHRRVLEKLSSQLEAAIVDVEMGEDAEASGLVEGLLGEDQAPESVTEQLARPVLYLQSTSEEGVRLLLGHAYGIEISNRFCVKTASEVALLARKYDIPVLLHKADAFLGKAMEDRTTDRLRCKPAFWASQKHGVTDCAMRFLIFAEQAGLPLMQRAVQNLLAHIIILDSTLDLTQHLLGGQVQRTTWQMIGQQVATLQKVLAGSSGAGNLSPASSMTISSNGSLSSSPSPDDSPRSVLASPRTPQAQQVSSAYAAHLARSSKPEPQAAAVGKPVAKQTHKRDQPLAYSASALSHRAQAAPLPGPRVPMWISAPMAMQPAWHYAAAQGCGYSQAYGYYPSYCYTPYPMATYTH